MVSLKSKDIIILLIGLVISIVLTSLSFLKTIEVNNFITIYIVLILILIIIGGFLWAINKRVDEIEKDLNNQKFEQKRLDEKLKIYERLSIIEAKLNLKNGSKK